MHYRYRPDRGSHDKQRIKPMLEALSKLENQFGKDTLLADNGYFSQNNVKACTKYGITPLIALGRKTHYLPIAQRLQLDTPESQTDRSSGHDGALAQITVKTRTLRHTQMHCRTCVWHYQTGVRLSSVPDARDSISSSSGRVETGYYDLHMQLWHGYFLS